MKKLSFNKPVRIEGTAFDELFDDTTDWSLKAERLIKRRERKLRRQMLHY